MVLRTWIYGAYAIPLVSNQGIHVDIDAKNSKGNTALHVAARAGDFDVTHAFINRGANLSLFGSEGFAARHVATRSNHHRVSCLLSMDHVPNSRVEAGAMMNRQFGLKVIAPQGRD